MYYFLCFKILNTLFKIKRPQQKSAVVFFIIEELFYFRIIS